MPAFPQAPVTGTAAQPGLHWVEWACELAGTALLLVGGLSAICLNFGRGSAMARLVPDHSVRLLITGLLFAGTGSLVTVSPIGRRSGAHLNPAVTTAFFLRRHVHWNDLVGYVVAQCLGALAGAAVVRGLWGSVALSVNLGVTQPRGGLDPWAAVGIECLMTAVLVLVILVMVSSSRTARWTPLAIWFVIAALVWQGAPWTGTSLNPARSLGPAVVVDIYLHLWIYVIGPLAGAFLAVGVFAWLPGETLTAKLFHDPSYPSTLRSSLPVG
ncbi:MAG: aquaporin [Acidimicrobiales bacterium]